MLSTFSRRLIAYVADYFVVFAILWTIAQLLFFIVIPYASFAFDYRIIVALLIVPILYFTILEKIKGTTVGKHLLFLRLVSTKNQNGNLFYKQAFIRNLSKICWFPIILDLIIGRLVGKSNERLLGRYSRTEVISEDIDSVNNSKQL